MRLWSGECKADDAARFCLTATVTVNVEDKAVASIAGAKDSA